MTTPKKKRTPKEKTKKNAAAKASASGRDRVANAPTPKLPPPVMMGAPGFVGNLGVTVRDARAVAPTPKSPKPPAGQQLLAVKVLVASKEGSAPVASALFDAVGQDGDHAGKRFRASLLPCTDTPLQAGTVSPQASVEGDLCFVVPEDAKLVLVIKSGGKDAASFKLGM